MKQFFLIVICLTFLDGSLALAQSTGPEVKKTLFEGNNVLSDDQLEQRLSIRRTSTLALIASGEDKYRYSPENGSADSATLTRFYQREGFLHVSVSTPRIIPDGKDKIKLSFQINEGIPVTVGKLDLAWSDTAYVHDTLRENLTALYMRSGNLRPGGRFRDSLVLMDADFLETELTERGFPYRQVSYRLEVSPDEKTVDIFWALAPGRKMYFDQFSVTGNERVSSKVILRQVPIKPGDHFSEDALEKTQRHVYTLAMFQIVTVRPQLDEARDSLVDVEILVDEAKRLNARVGVGWGAEEQFRVFTNTRYLSFFGGARQLAVEAKHSSLEPYNFSATLTQPAFPDRVSTFTVGPFLRRQKEVGFTVTRYGFSTVVSRPIMRFVNGVADYSFENVDLDEFETISEATLDSASVEKYTKSSISLGLTFDNSNPPITPTHGMFITSGVTLSGLGFGSDYRFMKLFFEVRRYQPLNIGDIGIGTRFKWGGIKPTGGNTFVPLEERFYSGGATSVRGWGRHELGEQIEGKPVGGNGVLEGTVELRIPAFAKFSVATFADVGNVWRPAFHFSLSDLRYSAGVGLRYATPIGPVRLDFARPINDVKKSWEIHLSIGEAF